MKRAQVSLNDFNFAFVNNYDLFAWIAFLNDCGASLLNRLLLAEQVNIVNILWNPVFDVRDLL